MNKNIKYIIIVFSLVSCEEFIYTPSKVNDVIIQRPENNIIVELTTKTNNDTIGGWGNIELSYVTDLDGKDLKSVDFYLDNNLLGSSEDDSSVYILNSLKYADGIYKLKVEVKAHSGSGSIADIEDVDLLVSSKEWTLIIDNAPPEAVNIENIEPYKGRLLITWKKYHRYNFQEYNIYQIVDSTEYLKFTINEQGTSEWIDNLYVGGEANYRVEIKAANISVKGDEREFIDEVSEIYELVVTPDDHLKINWSKCKYDSNFTSYSVWRFIGTKPAEYPGVLEKYECIGTIDNIQDTSFVDDEYGFGNKLNYKIATSPGYIYDPSGQPVTVSPSTLWRFNVLEYCTELNSFYLVGRHNVTRVDGITFKALATNTENHDWENFGISPIGNRVYISSDQYSISELDPITLEKIEDFPTEDFIGYPQYFNRFHVALHGKIIYFGYRFDPPTYYGQGLIGLDLIQGRQFLNIDDIGFLMNIRKMSANGKYCLIISASGRLLKIFNQNLVSIGNTAWEENFCFLGSGDSCLTTYQQTISIYETQSLNLLREFPITSDLYNPMIDPVTGYLGAYSVDENMYKIYNKTSGQLIKEIKLIPHINYEYNFFFANSTIFSSKGYFLKINLDQN